MKRLIIEIKINDDVREELAGNWSFLTDTQGL